MKLKALEIQGFKSFADKIKLNFDNGVTAVVGPNGSGKSNIADAVRWVLGEMSVKTLRGGKMEDVIFNGTEQRKALGVASVTLVIDNSTHELPYPDDEISVSRKLYRSGESEYRINENTVRLKDVYELFMDTGIGRDGYAIIGQGKVAEIVSARSKERREIFEEAAGISKFRYRKQEAEKQLILSEDDLSRLLDIENEIEGRLEPLRIQSEKAEKYLSLAGEKRKLDVSLSMYNLSNLNKENSETEDKYIIASNQHESVLKKFTENEEEYNRKVEASKSLNAEIEDIRAKGDEINEELSSLGSKTAVINNDISHYKASIEEINESMEKGFSSKDELLNELERLKREKGEKLLKLSSLREKQSGIKEEKQAIEKSQAENFKEIESCKLKRSGIFEAIEKAKVSMASSKSIISESTERLSQIDYSKAEFASQIEDIKREISDCETLSKEIEEKLSSIDNGIQGYALKKASRLKKLNEKTERVTEIRNEIGRRSQKAKLLTDMENSMEGFYGSVKVIIKASQTGRLQGIVGPVSSLITTDEKYSLAIETALGGALQNIVTETSENAKSAIFLLKNQKAGRATFLPIDTIRGNDADMGSLELLEGFVGKASELIKYDRRFNNIFSWLLGRIVIAEDLDTAMGIAKRSNNRYKIVTLDGQVINAGGSMTGGFTAKSSGILSRKSEIEKLNAECEELVSSIKNDEEDISSLTKEIASLDGEINAFEASKRALNEDKLRGEMHGKSLSLRLKEKENSLLQIEKEQAFVNKKIEELKGKGNESDKLFETLNNELSLMQEKLNELNAKRDSLNEEKEGILEKERQENTDILVLEENIQNSDREIENQTLIISSKESEKQASLLKIETLNEKIVSANKEIELLKVQDEKNKLLVKSLEEDIERKIRERNENDKALASLRDLEREIQGEKDELYKEVVRLGQKKEKLSGEISSIVASLYDQYELTLSMAEDESEKLTDIPASQKRLLELKGKIRSLGNVNLGAVEEYKEVKARYDEMKAQIADIENSKAELNKLITELTGQMCTIFSDKFKKISENFSSVFKELFGGGQAHLTLTEPDNVLESGIEISAAPPGKVIKNLSSLSGGEQSFVAIAIFFAILKVNPSPFCLMDEIEAALDDVNVNKFASYLHTLTDKTQFITITHRRGTMEEANVLYGVTMQEEGVSKLLKLDIDNVQKDFYK